MSDLVIRRLKKDDLNNGFLETLDNLYSASSSIDPKLAHKLFDELDSNTDYHIIVGELDGKVVSTATLLIEKKFIHGGSSVGLIEDVVTNEEYHNRGISQKIVEHMLGIAEKNQCYKTILYCPPELCDYYEKIGFVKTDYCMRFDPRRK